MVRNIDWGEAAAKVALGLILAMQIAMGIYVMESMTPIEKDNFIIQLQQEQMQE